MSIESAVQEIRRIGRKSGGIVPEPASEEDIAGLAREFEQEFEVALPQAYQRMLRVCDGFDFDGLVVWPTRPNSLSAQSLVDVNRDLRDEVEEELVFFGQRDDIWFVYDTQADRYAAVEMSGLSTWKTFATAEELIAFMLSRVVEQPEQGT